MEPCFRWPRNRIPKDNLHHAHEKIKPNFNKFRWIIARRNDILNENGRTGFTVSVGILGDSITFTDFSYSIDGEDNQEVRISLLWTWRGAENGENRENNVPFFGKRRQERLRPKIQRNDECFHNTLKHKRFSEHIKRPLRWGNGEKGNGGEVKSCTWQIKLKIRL